MPFLRFNEYFVYAIFLLMTSVTYVVESHCMEISTLDTYIHGKQLDCYGNCKYAISGVVAMILCLKECLRFSFCTAVNYNRAALECELVYIQGTLQTEMLVVNDTWAAVYTTDIPQVLVGVCANHNCLFSQKCVELTSGARACVNHVYGDVHDVQNLAQNTNAAVLALSETWLDDYVTATELDIDNYTLLRCDRNRNGGGVCLYVRNNIGYTARNDLTNKNIEIYGDVHDVQNLAQNTNAAVLALSETWLDDYVTATELDIDNYTLLRCDRNRNGGGVCLYVRNNIGYTARNDLTNKNIESIVLAPGLYGDLIPNTRLYHPQGTTGLTMYECTALPDQGPTTSYPVSRLVDGVYTRANVSCSASDCFDPAVPYAGQVSVTEDGTVCQRWDSTTPHSPYYHTNRPDLENWCRLGGGEPRPWCYTTDPTKRWDFCPIITCP